MVLTLYHQVMKECTEIWRYKDGWPVSRYIHIYLKNHRVGGKNGRKKAAHTKVSSETLYVHMYLYSCASVEYRRRSYSSRSWETFSWVYSYKVAQFLTLMMSCLIMRGLQRYQRRAEACRT